MHFNNLLDPFQYQTLSPSGHFINQRLAFKEPCFEIFDINAIEFTTDRCYLICIQIIPAVDQSILANDVGLTQLNDGYFFLVEFVVLVLVLDVFVEHDVAALDDVKVLAALLVLPEDELVFDEFDL
jgi:hypothetical protein